MSHRQLVLVGAEQTSIVIIYYDEDARGAVPCRVADGEDQWERVTVVDLARQPLVGASNPREGNGSGVRHDADDTLRCCCSILERENESDYGALTLATPCGCLGCASESHPRRLTLPPKLH